MARSSEKLEERLVSALALLIARGEACARRFLLAVLLPIGRSLWTRTAPARVRAWRYLGPPCLRVHRSIARPAGAWLHRRAWAPAREWLGRLCLQHVAHGDEAFARAFSRSFFAHLLVIFVSALPMFFDLFGCVRPVDIPKGDDAAAQQVVKKIQVKVRRWIVNPLSAIRLDYPQPDKVELNLEKQTEHPWTGAVGAGGTPGFRGGTAAGEIPFIRLKHGGDWDNDIDADDNMLREFGRITRIRVRPRAETLPVGKLLNFPKKRSPPCVYIYGTRVCGLTDDEIIALRRYLTERGGMLIADAGGPGFDSSFRSVVSRLFPGLRLIDIPNDDEIYQRPCPLPHGAPALWHHGGRRALGLRYQGRLVIFYHPGDMNDAWKTGHSGASRDVAEAAYQVGANVMHYAVRQYLHFIGRDE